MRALSKLKNRGFTLIELMIVVAIVGVLAALAIYGVRRYLLNSKTTEATNALGQMAKDAKTAYEREAMSASLLSLGGTAAGSNNLCSSGTAAVPSTVAVVANQKYQSSPSEWTVDASTMGKGFACLKFTLSDPQYYMYTYNGSTGTNGTFTAMANGDLDGNGNTSTFSIIGSVTSGFVLVAPNLKTVSPEE